MTELEKAFHALREQATGMDMVDEVRLVTSSYSPVRWQATARHRNRTKAFGVGVSEDPAEAFAEAIANAYSNRKSGAAPFYHERKELATEHLAALTDIYGPSIAAAKVEFEPYKGFLIVIWPEEGHEGKLRRLQGEVEFRYPNTPGESRSPSTPPATAAPTPQGRAGKMSRQDMEDLWKSKHGKFPPRDWKKPKLMEELQKEGLVD